MQKPSTSLSQSNKKNLKSEKIICSEEFQAQVKE